MSEDCKYCGTMMYLLDSEGLCPACNGLGFDEEGEPIYEDEYDWYCWEEQDFMENRVVYENDLEHLLELPTKEKHR